MSPADTGFNCKFKCQKADTMQVKLILAVHEVMQEERHTSLKMHF